MLKTAFVLVLVTVGISWYLKWVFHSRFLISERPSFLFSTTQILSLNNNCRLVVPKVVRCSLQIQVHVEILQLVFWCFICFMRKRLFFSMQIILMLCFMRKHLFLMEIIFVWFIWWENAFFFNGDYFDVWFVLWENAFLMEFIFKIRNRLVVFK